MGIFSSPAAWAQTTTTLTFKQNGNAICDTVQLVEDTSGFIRGRQIADNCPNGDYILTGRRNNAQGYVLYTGASGAGMTQLLFNAGGSVEALQLNGTTTPTPSAAWAGVTWGVGTNGGTAGVNVAVATMAQMAGNYRMTSQQAVVGYYNDFVLNVDGSCTYSEMGDPPSPCTWSYNSGTQIFHLASSRSQAGADGAITGSTSSFTLDGKAGDGSPFVQTFTRQ